MQGAEAGQLEHAGRDVCPEPHSAQGGLADALSQRSDVQAGNLMLHLCSAASPTRGEKRRSFQHIGRGVCVFVCVSLPKIPLLCASTCESVCVWGVSVPAFQPDVLV